jgi:hypothetical protein
MNLNQPCPSLRLDNGGHCVCGTNGLLVFWIAQRKGYFQRPLNHLPATFFTILTGDCSAFPSVPRRLPLAEGTGLCFGRNRVPGCRRFI